MENFDFAQLQQQTEKRFSSLGNAGTDMTYLLEELDNICAEAETLIQQQKEGDRNLIACAAGCQCCCVVNVSTTLLEGISIAGFLRQLDSSVLIQVTSTLDKLWRDVRGFDEDERLLARRKCAFLDDRGWCLIYPVRPLFCRSVTSTDAEICRTAITGPALGERHTVMMHQFQLQLYKTLFSGVAEGLAQAGLDGRCFQLSGLVRYLLSHPDEEGELLRGAALSWDEIYP